MPPTRLGEYLKAKREELGLSLREVEKRGGVHNAHISQIESGTIERPAPHILWSLAAVYEVEYDTLMRLAGHVGPEIPATGAAAGAALRAFGLTPEQEKAVIDYIEDIKKSGEEGRDEHRDHR